MLCRILGVDSVNFRGNVSYELFTITLRLLFNSSSSDRGSSGVPGSLLDL